MSTWRADEDPPEDFFNLLYAETDGDEGGDEVSSEEELVSDDELDDEVGCKTYYYY